MPDSTARAILERHAETLSGTLQRRYVRSRALGLRKPFYVYEPPEWEAMRRLPILYLFRGHEREWVNPEEDSSRQHRTAIEDVDRLIRLGLLPPMLCVMPGLASSDNHVPALGVDMVGAWPEEQQGLGTGRFWTFLTQELLPRTERRYHKQAAGGLRMAAGFSLGGYTVSLLAAKHPGYLHHAAIYDGTLTWPGHDDPREDDDTDAPNDPIWTEATLFDAALGQPRDDDALAGWNATDLLLGSSGKQLALQRLTRFWVRCAAGDGQIGNRDRARFFTQQLRGRGFWLGFDGLPLELHPEAAHTWHWCDRFLGHFLAGVFGVDLKKVSSIR